MIKIETWKKIKGYEGLYEISNLGRVKRLYKNKKEKILKPIRDSYGYMQYSLSKDSKNKSIRIHRLVALHFIDNPNNYPEVNHIDGNKENYSIDNLEWCTRSQNMKHAHSLGLIYVDKATEAIKIITEDKITIIKKMKSLGFSYMRFKCKGASNAYVEKVVPNYLYSGWDLLCIAPLWQQAFDWFREKYAYFTSFDYQHGENNGFFYCVINIEDEEFYFPEDFEPNIYKIYEEAKQACLEKLIELCEK